MLKSSSFYKTIINRLSMTFGRGSRMSIKLLSFSLKRFERKEEALERVIIIEY